MFTLTWKKEVDPSVMIGDLTSGLDITCIRKTSDIERLYNRQLCSFSSLQVYASSLEIRSEEARYENLLIVS